MEIIRNSDLMIMSILGQPAVNANTEKRMIKNCLFYEVENGTVISNSLTRAIVFIPDEELDELGDINKFYFLYKNYFFVDADFDEWEAFEKIKSSQRQPLDDLYLRHPSGYVIVTTTKCNARCAYCYEKNYKNKKHMSEEMALKVADYILNASPIDQPADLSWFGGEPLINIKIINIITEYLRDNGKPFVSNITTNGYLLDEKLIKKAKYSWNVNNVQITLDGIEQVYNKVKNYIKKDNISPYAKVMENIGILLNENITVHIRMNVDNNNVNDFKILLNELYKNFGNNYYLQPYVYPIFDEKNERTYEENVKLYNSLIELDNLICSLGFKEGDNILGPSMKCTQCMADNGATILINEEGQFTVCEHYLNEHIVGNIDNPNEKDMEELKYWKQYTNNKELCNECPILGDCIKVKGCVDMGDCEEYKKNWHIQKHWRALQRIYNDYLNSKNNNYCKSC